MVAVKLGKQPKTLEFGAPIDWDAAFALLEDGEREEISSWPLHEQRMYVRKVWEDHQSDIAEDSLRMGKVAA